MCNTIEMRGAERGLWSVGWRSMYNESSLAKMSGVLY